MTLDFQYFTEAKKANGPCVVCKKSHTYERNFPFGKAKVPSRRLSACDEFKKKSVHDRGVFVESIKACYSCLDPKHEASSCPFKAKRSCTEKINGVNCGGKHNTLLHNSGVAYCHNTPAPFGDTHMFSLKFRSCTCPESILPP